MWNQWILQNQWPWLFLCTVVFSAKPQGLQSPNGIAVFRQCHIIPAPAFGNVVQFGHRGRGTAGAIPASAAGTEGGTRYFSWGTVGSLQLPSGAFLPPWSGWKVHRSRAGALPRLLRPFPGCFIPSLPAASLPFLLRPFPAYSIPSLLCLCRCCRSLARLRSVPERGAGATAQPRGSACVQPCPCPVLGLCPCPGAVPMFCSGAVPMPMSMPWPHRDTLGCAHPIPLGLHLLPAPARASLTPQPSRVTLPATAQPHTEPRLSDRDQDSRARGREKPFLFFSTAVKKEKVPGLTQIDPGAAPSAGASSPKPGLLAAQGARVGAAPSQPLCLLCPHSLRFFTHSPPSPLPPPLPSLWGPTLIPDQTKSCTLAPGQVLHLKTPKQGM